MRPSRTLLSKIDKKLKSKRTKAEDNDRFFIEIEIIDTNQSQNPNEYTSKVKRIEIPRPEPDIIDVMRKEQRP